jgi:DNA-3-methyladenine glycosylase II
MSVVHIQVPKEFDFAQNLQFLKRSPKEVLHRVEENCVVKLLQIEGERVLFRVKDSGKGLSLEFINLVPSAIVKNQIKNYVNEWFDLETDLTPFYKLARKDNLLGSLVKRHYGYRIIGQPDLFESLVWAVLGQQINLQFAYTLKQRFVENFGERLSWKNQDYFLFPTPLRVVSLRDDDLLPLQFSRQKSKYVVNIAEAFTSGRISKAHLKDLSLQEANEILMSVKGIGNWTANYALMKTFRYPDAFPLEDAGLHNAIRNLKGMKKKPSFDQVRRIFKKYKGWEAYATLYLWKSL